MRMMKRTTLSLLAAVLTTGTVAMGQREVQPAQANPPREGITPSQPTAAEPRAGSEKAGQNTQLSDERFVDALRKASERTENAGDRMWVLGAAMHNEFEIAFSRQAAQKATDPQVKQLAQRMVEEHTAAGQQLKQTAQSLQLELPQGLPSLKQEKLTAASKLEGKMYDDKYLCHLYVGHAESVASYQLAANNAKEVQVKQYASQTLPKLQKHQQQVNQQVASRGLLGNQSEAQPAAGKLPAQRDTTDRDAATPAPRDETTPRDSGTPREPGSTGKPINPAQPGEPAPRQ